MAGWLEVMPLILCSHDENFSWLNRKDDGTTAVRLANPKTAEYQVQSKHICCTRLHWD